MDMDKKEGTMTVVLLKVPPQLLSRNKHQKNRWALSELETKQCPLLAPAAEENSCLRREIIFFSAVAELVSANSRMHISSRGAGLHSRVCCSVQGHLRASQTRCNWSSEPRTGDNPGAISPLASEASTADFHGSRIRYKHLLSTAEHLIQVQGETKAFSKR